MPKSTPKSEPKSAPIRLDEVEELFRRHNRSLVQLLTTRLGSPQAAREVAQEAYVRLLKLDEDRLVSYQRTNEEQTRGNKRGTNEDIHYSDHSVTPNDQD